MSVSLLVLTLFNIILLAGLSFSIFLRVKEKKEDQKLTKGLQLLQNKLSILQDLSDRTDEQVHKLVHLLDSKSADIRIAMKEANHLLEEVRTAPAQYIQQAAQPANDSAAYNAKSAAVVKAAQLSNAGADIEQIIQETELNRSEVEMIMAVHRHNLQFSAESLPDWAQETTSISNQELDEFSKALMQQQYSKPASSSMAAIVEVVAPQQNKTANTEVSNVRPIEFRRI